MLKPNASTNKAFSSTSSFNPYFNWYSYTIKYKYILANRVWMLIMTKSIAADIIICAMYCRVTNIV